MQGQFHQDLTSRSIYLLRSHFLTRKHLISHKHPIRYYQQFQNKLQFQHIIGQLYAGTAACSGTVDNNGWDVYGRLGVSWSGNGSSTNRLSDWLDPNGTSPTYIESYPPFETFAIDGGITSVDSPETGNLSDNENITITLRNFGENDISNFDCIT